ncbi:DUF4199 domain-containing protein [Aquimarina brevivitae]|uniref:Uncharacterized protein DUF4199 n=1 Tax=Aquimarina brevivitae TaxID=323412 RepID=A0A4V2F5N8_9FLAO|nr:DUF4199 domain-containing protein [Aquimarina brevivitae]RZS93469.1 uncharacterized protein DUF4199 [Aquimarina brevivitae]
MENQTNTNKIGINYGIILATILTLFTVLGYAFYQEIFVKWWVFFLLLIVIVLIGILSAVKSRKILGGIISFKETFKAYFIPIVIGTLISTLVTILIFNVIDPEAAVAIKDRSIEVTMEFMQKFNVPEEDMNKAIADIRNADNFGALTQIKNWFGSMIVYIVIGLIVSLIIRKKEPIE